MTKSPGLPAGAFAYQQVDAQWSALGTCHVLAVLAVGKSDTPAGVVVTGIRGWSTAVCIAADSRPCAFAIDSGKLFLRGWTRYFRHDAHGSGDVLFKDEFGAYLAERDSRLDLDRTARSPVVGEIVRPRSGGDTGQVVDVVLDDLVDRPHVVGVCGLGRGSALGEPGVGGS